MLNQGKQQIGISGAPNHISYGTQSPAVDAVPLAWNAGDVRFSCHASAPNTSRWVCTVAGTPGTWVQIDDGGVGPAGATGATGPASTTFDLLLSYGNQNADGALPTPPEATPSFYLRPNTDKTVQMSFSGSPGATWEYEVAETLGLVNVTVDIYIYSCALTPAGAGPATLTMSQTVNGAASFTSANLDGTTNQRVTLTGTAFISAGFRIGILVITTNVGSGFLMATAHVRMST